MTISIQNSLPLRSRRRIRLAWFGTGVLALFGTVGGFGMAGFRINMTPSEPVGLWRILPLDHAVRKGDLIFICPSATGQMREARRRGYLRSGLCAGGVAPLIKTVAATSGQVVQIAGEVRIDGRRLDHSRLMTSDARGRPIEPYPGGAVPQGSVFLHSDFPASFDSRYFGPLPIENVLGRAQEIWTYAR